MRERKAVVRKFYGQQLGYVESIASTFYCFRDCISLYHAITRELSEPQKLLPHLLQPDVTTLPPDTIAVYISATTKIFGYWASELAQKWDDDDLPEVKRVVETISARMSELVSSPHIEVQERVCGS
jgi:hypothetical protein